MECKDFEPSIIQDKDQILRLCKRLKSCTLNDLTAILEVDENIVQTVLFYLEQESLIQINNEIITVLDGKPVNKVFTKSLHLMFQYQTPEDIDLLLRGFCINISPNKMCHLVKVGNSCICDYYCIFRKLIYDRQLKELLQKFFQKPQQGRFRKFFEKYAYFYVYNNQIYVTEKLLRASEEKNFTNEEIREFKRMYCYLARVESHNMNENYLYHRLAEFIWRREKTFDKLYSDLKNIVFS